MEKLNIEHEKINSTKKHLQRAWWIVSIIEAVSAFIGYIIIAVAFQRVIDICKMEGLPTSDLAGYCALIFFVMLLGSALFIYLIYILKEYMQVKLCCCSDVKLLRDEIKTINKNNVSLNYNDNIGMIRKTDSNDLCAIASIEYHIWSKSCLAYVVYVATQDGENRQITFSRDENKAMTFKSREDALEFASKNKLDTEKDFLII